MSALSNENLPLACLRLAPNLRSRPGSGGVQRDGPGGGRRRRGGGWGRGVVALSRSRAGDADGGPGRH